MDIYKHTVVSLAISAIFLAIFKKIQLSVACFATGVFVDIDHLFDYTINHDLREKIGYFLHPKKLAKFLSEGYKESKPTEKLYKPLHSLELILFAPLLYALGVWNDIATGIIIGFSVHLIMDLMPIGHIGAISLIYKIVNGFPKGSDIIKARFSKIGRDVNQCQRCGTIGETIIHKERFQWYMGFTKKSLGKTEILCKRCHDKIHLANLEKQR